MGPQVRVRQDRGFLTFATTHIRLRLAAVVIKAAGQKLHKRRHNPYIEQQQFLATEARKIVSFTGIHTEQ